MTITSSQATVPGEVTRSIVASFAAQLNADRLAFATALAAGAPQAETAELIRLVSTLRIPLQAVERPVGAHELKVISYYSPGYGDLLPAVHDQLHGAELLRRTAPRA